MPGTTTIAQPHPLNYAFGRAARELDLRRGEFDLAVHLGRIRTVPDEGGGGRRVPWTEIERLRDRTETLRESVKAVGTTEGAALMEIPPGRFTRFAKLGLVTPVKWYPNRYRAVVWLYLAEELRQFAADEKNARLLTGRTPEELRDRLRAGADQRARNWRGRHCGFLLRQTEGPWQRAGVVAGFLDPGEIDDLLTDPHERAYVRAFLPVPPAHGAPGSPVALLAEELMTADDPDEIDWFRNDLAREVAEARTLRPAPRPAAPPQLTVPAEPRPAHAPARPKHPRGLRGWLLRRSPRPTHPLTGPDRVG
ncbi:hypothetical protein EDD90_9145 [Streptomyces sp. Ag109_O5-1]|uniref:DUF6397 family protein n=1 Tax=Streptomyces sp. Ag109_O5-1 TaxID=1938851 RepID=UPI000F50B93A|nr:DUF6397 family protein [Streptomyces sp. Ag109_O5-1]RPE45831.1 hypothetical protein EDD90_9145 [Streptomyces sp. Ag109_O5-1]